MATSSWMPSGFVGWCRAITLGVDFPPSGWGGSPSARLSGCWFSLLLSSERLTGSASGLGWLSAGLGGGEGEDWAVTGLLSGGRRYHRKIVSLDTAIAEVSLYVD